MPTSKERKKAQLDKRKALLAGRADVLASLAKHSLPAAHLELIRSSASLGVSIAFFTGGAQVAWMLLSHIVLLNALIAMMNTTYGEVYEQQEAEWRLQFLEQVLMVEATPPIHRPRNS